MSAQTEDTKVVSCAVCGARFETVAESMGHDHLKSDTGLQDSSPEDVALFEKIWDAEFDVKGERVSVAFAPGNLPLYLKNSRANNLRKAKDKLNALIDSLTLDQGKAYGDYRRRMLAEIAAMG